MGDKARATIEVEIARDDCGVVRGCFVGNNPELGFDVKFHSLTPLNDAARELLEPKVPKWLEKLRDRMLCCINDAKTNTDRGDACARVTAQFAHERVSWISESIVMGCDMNSILREELKRLYKGCEYDAD